MVPREQIETFVDAVVRRFAPEQVVLFGSHAYGVPTDDSDVDLLIVVPHRGSNAEMASKIRLACPRTFSLDLLVRTPVELRRRLEMGDPFMREITSKGTVLHDASHARVG